MQVIPSTLDAVREYYGHILQGSGDLKTSACCAPEAMPRYLRDILAEIDDEILDRFYGCGSPIPLALDGCTVLDLGCGTGRDVYLASRLVGEDGHVIGLDMTEGQLAVAQRHRESQAERFGFATPNVDFRFGYIEDLQDAGIEDGSVDVVISNCVINLSPDKQRVFSEIFRVLKPGGELYFSDVFADRRISADLAADPELYGECLSGALYIEDFRRMLRDLGCLDHRTVTTRSIDINNEALQARVGNIQFYSMTIRAFKLPDSLEDICEDYGQVAYYEGTIPEAPHTFVLDDHHVFETGRPMLVCGNTATMVSETRYGQHFRIVGDRSTHYGAFDCAPATETTEDTAPGGCC
jgi:SAM-dependent methyltransferase